MIQRAYTTILRHFIGTGRAPHYCELAEALDLDVDAARDLQRDTIASASAVTAAWLAQDTDYIESFAPFSNVPTPILLSVDGKQKWYGQ